MPVPPNRNWGAPDLKGVRRCPTFPPGLGSIIGAGRLSFRVRDGSGRFPVAMSAVTFFGCWVTAGPCGGGVSVPCQVLFWWWGVDCLWFVVWLRAVWCFTSPCFGVLFRFGVL